MAAWKFCELQKIFAGLRPNKEIFAALALANTQKNLGSLTMQSISMA